MERISFPPTSIKPQRSLYSPKGISAIRLDNPAHLIIRQPSWHNLALLPHLLVGCDLLVVLLDLSLSAALPLVRSLGGLLGEGRVVGVGVRNSFSRLGLLSGSRSRDVGVGAHFDWLGSREVGRDVGVLEGQVG